MSGPSKSANPPATNRFRPIMERLESREVPAVVTLPDVFVVRAGRILDVNTTGIFGVGGVLNNDVDDTNAPVSNAGLRVVRFTQPIDSATGLALGTPFKLLSDGTFSFRAPHNFNGVATFTYQAASSGGLLSTFETVSIRVINPVRRLAVGADQGSTPSVAVYDVTGQNLLFNFQAFDTSFKGGVRVALGDFNGDNIQDIVVAAGPRGGPHIKIIDGRTGEQLSSFFAFDPAFRGGVEVATGDLNGDGIDDLIVSAGSGANAHVKVFNGNAVTRGGFNGNAIGDQLASFFAYNTGETNGVRVAAGEIDADGIIKLVTAPASGSTLVKVFDLSGGTAVQTKNFFAGDSKDARGLYVAVGDLNNDFLDDIVVGSGSGTPEARIYIRNPVDRNQMIFSRAITSVGFSDSFVSDAFTNPLNTNAIPDYLGNTLTAPTPIPTSFAGGPTTPKPGFLQGYTGGMRVAVSFNNSDNFGDITLAQGPNGFPRVQILNGIDLSTIEDFTVFTGFFGGLNVAGHH